MSDDAPFLRAIHEDRADATRRRVYADWLEERGDPRAEYLRLTCRLGELESTLDLAWQSAVRPSVARWFPLRTGRSIYLDQLRQFSVYRGLLEGLPTTDLNRRLIDDLLRRESANGMTPYLIPPTETPIPWDRDEPYFGGRFGTPAALPEIGCVAEFRSFDPVRNPEEHYSWLVIIWFQRDFAFPIDPAALKSLLEIDWERHAVDATD